MYCSIIIPTYDQERYIDECIQSVITQEHTEIIVVNDGSTDRSLDIIKKYEDKIKIIDQVNRGAGNALNVGIEASSGDFICWMGADDKFYPNKIEKQLEFFRLRPEADIVFSNFSAIDENGVVLKESFMLSIPDHKDYMKIMLIRNFINSATVMMKREVYDDIGLYNEELKADNDAEYWFRCLIAGYKFHFIDIPLVSYRIHANQISADWNRMTIAKDIVRKGVIERVQPEFLFNASGNFAEYYNKLGHALFEQFMFGSAMSAKLKELRYAT